MELPLTELLYMQDFDVETTPANIQKITSCEDGLIDIVLDQTCFYPRVGGQDWNTGIIQKDDINFIVEEVRLDEHGDVHHIGTVSTGSLADGDQVTCIVNHELRSINTRLHSAGHIVDMAVEALKLPWITIKGAHYQHTSFVEYSAEEFNQAKCADITTAIEVYANKFIAAGTINKLLFMPLDQLHTVCRHIPTNIPSNKPVCVVIYSENFGVPCGGTHVHNLADVGTIKIIKIKQKSGIIKVSYSVKGIN